MADYLALDVRQLEREIGSLLEAYPELADDEELRADVLEGETDLEHIASRIVRRRNLARANVSGIKEVMADFKERQERFQRQEDAMKAMLKRILSLAGTDKLTLPEATISISKPRESVEVLDVEALPQGYFKTIRQADKTAIGEALKAGEAIPGAALVLGEPGLTIRSR
ncbi:siphovirus Gp157 family protein [Pelagibacterium sp. 26DY04]|uniref:siphovirus Gp157 family protein n=1 Tax=Pelagibacterium sp. 26DY04 TaxID=2967130 RepID=UPI0028167883|nr:siphovirus Gp157 family protein [Pelagibacterium sp. 26DY04]WMT88239.1 siphovirus Gp157 family protein [Pelagibacterium sp. 26DY04]